MVIGFFQDFLALKDMAFDATILCK